MSAIHLMGSPVVVIVLNSRTNRAKTRLQFIDNVGFIASGEI